MTESEKNTKKQGVKISLPAKVTGIVFWGMVLMGVLVASYLLSQKEAQLRERYLGNLLFIEHEMEQLYASYDEYIFDHDFMRLQVVDYFQKAQQRYPVEAIHYSFSGQEYLIGEVGGQQERMQGQLLIRVLSNQGMQVVDMELYMEGLNVTIGEARKQMIMIIGLMVFLFGLVLQQILQKVLSAPIMEMVGSVQKFAGGDQSARFDESRNDEFGYLSRFVNQALDAIVEQQKEIEASRRELYEEKVQAEITLHSIMDGVITTDADNLIRYINPVAERLMGVNLARVEGQDLNRVIRLIDEDGGGYLEPPTVDCLNHRQVTALKGNAALASADGAVIHIEASAAPMRNDQGAVIGAVMVLQDVSQERSLSRQLSYQASHDMLTGLFNRRMFEEQLDAALSNVQIENRHHALFYLDLDQFKIVNDTCGHVAGDELLRQLSDLLKSCIRDGDVLARLGGDEFGLLLENCELAQAVKVADKIRQSVRDYRFAWDDKSFEVGASIGVVAINVDNVDMASILASADMACYAAKDMGRNRVHVYEPSDAVLAERHGQMHWASRISQAMDENRMVLFEQAIVSTTETRNTTHCEVLIRMLDEEGALVSPGAFIPAAERYNLMTKLDRWVIHEVFSQIAEHQGEDDGYRMVAINLSGMSLVEDDLLNYVLNEAEKYHVDLSRICFEVTETAAISNLTRATYLIRELRRQGCRFALDDFGSGLSSFNYLKNLPIDYLKIDGSFVVDVLSDPIDRAMVEAIVAVGHVMQVKVIAEWVENQETLDMLREMGVDYVQGYHTGAPVKAGFTA